MAKLNVVIPDEFVEVVGKDGARTKYRKVTRKARVGDIVRITGSGYVDVEKGAFYPVEDGAKYNNPGVVSIVDDGGDFRWGPLSDGKDWEVYEKVTKQYREVKRPAKVGERIKVVNEQMACGEYKTGAEMVVTEAKWPNIHSVNADYNGTEQHLFYEEYVVLEPIDERLTVGDIVKTLDESGFCKIGDIVKIVEDDGSDVPYRTESLSGEYAGWLLEDDVVRATEAEVAAAKEALDPRSKFAKGDKVRIVSGAGERFLLGYKNGDIVEIRSGADKDGDYSLSSPRDGVTPGNAKADQLEKVSVDEAAEFERKQAEEKRWAEIGREVGEFKIGDIVSFVKDSGKIKGIGTVEDVSARAIGVRNSATTWDGSRYEGVWFGRGDTATLITPVEQRFDREEAA